MNQKENKKIKNNDIVKIWHRNEEFKAELKLKDTSVDSLVKLDIGILAITTLIHLV